MTIVSDNTQTRRQREHIRHKHDILMAAEAVFVEKGYNGATIADIAQRSEFSVGSIYNFFSGKADLCRSVMLRIAQERVDDARALIRTGFPSEEEAFRAIIRAWISHHARHGAFLHMMMEHMHTHQQRPSEEVKKLLDEYRDLIRAFFAKGIESGFFRPCTADCLFIAYEGICHSFVFQMERQRKKSLEETGEALQTTLMTLFVVGKE